MKKKAAQDLGILAVWAKQNKQLFLALVTTFSSSNISYSFSPDLLFFSTSWQPLSPSFLSLHASILLLPLPLSVYFPVSAELL